ncbi:hypothetical protein WA026_004956 [Henosepilachna vigintioctopunctata]|uniref:Uncharacterized protein n=1 Tax=Henosepilachna vigintioctopunctata TaxID=420089 RepID=A0AAW1UK77_9CUCU
MHQSKVKVNLKSKSPIVMDKKERSKGEKIIIGRTYGRSAWSRDTDQQTIKKTLKAQLLNGPTRLQTARYRFTASQPMEDRTN